MWLDGGTGIDLIQWPVEEVESLRQLQDHVAKSEFKLKAQQLKKIGKLRGPQVSLRYLQQLCPPFKSIC